MGHILYQQYKIQGQSVLFGIGAPGRARWLVKVGKVKSR